MTHRALHNSVRRNPTEACTKYVPQMVDRKVSLCLAKTRSTFEINKMQRGCVTRYMGPAGAVMGQTRFSVGTNGLIERAQSSTLSSTASPKRASD